MKAIRTVLLFAFLLGQSSADADWIWTRQIITGVGSVRSLEYGNGLFVAGTNTGYMLSSRDGINWTSTRPVTVAINDIVYGHGRFVAVVAATDTTTAKILYSFDGATWSFAKRRDNDALFGSAYKLSEVGARSSGFISLGAAKNALASSVTGLRWENPLIGKKPKMYVGSISGLATSGSSYVMCSTLAGATIQTSGDGLAWTTRYMTSTRGPARGISARKPTDLLVCVGENGLCLASSSAGISWRSVPFGSTDFQGIAASADLFVSFTDKMVFSTTSGNSWTRELRIERSSDHLHSIAAGSGLYIVGGSRGKNGLFMVSAAVPAPSPSPSPVDGNP